MEPAQKDKAARSQFIAKLHEYALLLFLDGARPVSGKTGAPQAG